MKLLSHALSPAGLIGLIMICAPVAAQANEAPERAGFSPPARHSVEADKSGGNTCPQWRCGFNGVADTGAKLRISTFTPPSTANSSSKPGVQAVTLRDGRRVSID